MNAFLVVRPCAALVKDIEFSRCGKDGEMRLRSMNLLRGAVWDFDMEAFSLLYVFPSDAADVVKACPEEFTPLKRVVPATIPYNEPEAEDACV